MSSILNPITMLKPLYLVLDQVSSHTNNNLKVINQIFLEMCKSPITGLNYKE